MNITDYVRNFGDKTFDVMPFNRVDALVLSQFAYFKLDGFVPGVGTFTDAVPLYRMASSDKTADLIGPRHVHVISAVVGIGIPVGADLFGERDQRRAAVAAEARRLRVFDFAVGTVFHVGSPFLTVNSMVQRSFSLM